MDPIVTKTAISAGSKVVKSKGFKQVIIGLALAFLLFFAVIVAIFSSQGKSSNEFAGALGFPAEEFNTENPINSPFGIRADPFSGGGAFHQGIDIATVHHTKILATADGEVVNIGNGSIPPFQGYGGSVIIKHQINDFKLEGDNDDVFYSMYAHMSGILVQKGQRVTQGTPIGIEGGGAGDPMAGSSTGNHLHFELRKDELGGFVDPEPYLFSFLGVMTMESESGSSGFTEHGVGRTNDENLAFDTGGGMSYGLFQLSSKQGIVAQFHAFVKEKYPNLNLEGTDYTVQGGTFYNSWKKLAKNQTIVFGRAQMHFAKVQYYDNIATHLKNNGFDLNSRSRGLKEATFSLAINLGVGGIRNAFDSADLSGSDSSILKSIYASAKSQKPFNASRFDRELERCLNWK